MNSNEIGYLFFQLFFFSIFFKLSLNVSQHFDYHNFLCCLIVSSQRTAAARPINSGGSATVTVREPHRFATVFLDDDIYTSLFEIDVVSQGIGNNADGFMAVTVADVWHQKGEQQWQLWNPETLALMPFNHAVLGEKVQMQVIDKQLLGAGNYEIYTG